MIKSIIVRNIASFADDPQELSSLSKFNFIYGSNGTGKTSIGKVLSAPSQYPDCSVSWDNNIALTTLVYNRDFVEKNFNQSKHLKGIFTLGEDALDVRQKISDKKRELDEIVKKKSDLLKTLQGESTDGGKKKELQDLEDRFRERCWKQKQKHDEKLQGAFVGYRNSQEGFKFKILEESESNQAPLEELRSIEDKAKTVFAESLEGVIPFTILSTDGLLNLETNPILSKKIIGKDDVDIAEIIQKLDNSDWVQKGIEYFDLNNSICPFCQQMVPEKFRRSLEKYFDETFESDKRALERLESDYLSKVEQYQNTIQAVTQESNQFLDSENIESEKKLLDSLIDSNSILLRDKRKEPSRPIVLKSIKDISKSIDHKITAANSKIKEHNDLVKNLKQERISLTSKVWKYLLEVELKDEIERYKKHKDSFNKAIQSIENQIGVLEENETRTEREINNLERQTTSVQPTADAINGLLKSFGFDSFSLAKAEGFNYKLIRPDGEDAKETLSEGEASFITFLYFYHLLKGSNSESDITTNRVVVFDDPVSSLDSDILFIVSSLIKGLFTDVRAGDKLIKQVFVFTHNVYFHKEVTFNQKRKEEALKEETFWVVRKSGQRSRINKHNTNPVKTYYELLWSEVRNRDRSSTSIQNVLRRIIENYFKILGNVNPNEICEKFEGREKFICKSLFSWINDGSHNALDDLFITTSDDIVEKFLDVFKNVFVKNGHVQHYNMMMGISDST